MLIFQYGTVQNLVEKVVCTISVWTFGEIVTDILEFFEHTIFVFVDYLIDFPEAALAD